MLITNYGYGGAQRVFSQLTNGLSDDFHIMKIVFNNDEVDVYPSQGANISLNINAGANLFLKLINFFHRCWKLKKLKKKYSPKFIISHLEGANFVNILATGGSSSILCVHGSKTAQDSNRKGLIKFVENKLLTPILYNRAYKIVTVSNGIAKELTSHFNIKKQLLQPIQNGVDIKKIQQLSEIELSQEEKHLFRKKTIIFSGRFAPQKNPLALIDIYSHLDRRNEINLLLVGDGPLKDEMIKKCNENKLKFQDGLNSIKKNSDINVFFLGFYENPFKLLKNATLFALTSHFEGFPLAPCEAMSVGLPVIATDCPTGTREILAPSTNSNTKFKLKASEITDYGILMPLITDYDSTETWVNEISQRIFNQEWIKSTLKASKIRASQLSLENYINKWKELLSRKI